MYTPLRGIKNCMKKRTVDVRKECVHPLLEPKDIVPDELHLFLRKLCMVNETSTYTETSAHYGDTGFVIIHISLYAIIICITIILPEQALQFWCYSVRVSI